MSEDSLPTPFSLTMVASTTAPIFGTSSINGWYINRGALNGTATITSGGTGTASSLSTINRLGSISYIPAANFSGTDNFQVAVFGTDGTEYATVTVTVNPVADVFRVSSTAFSGRNGSDFGNNAMTLAEALGAARTNDQIWLKTGTYKPTTGSDRTLSLAPSANVTMFGGFSGSETSTDQRVIPNAPTILSGDVGTAGVMTDNSYHVVTTTTGVILDGLIVEGGYADGSSPLRPDDNSGGGVYATGATTVRNCVIRNHVATYVGAGFSSSDGGSMVISATIFQGNTAPYGSAYCGQRGATHAFTNVIFHGNGSGGTIQGSCVWFNDSSTWINCTVNGNVGGGNALHLSSGSHSLVNTIVFGNTGSISGSYTGSNNSFSNPLFFNPTAPAGLDGLWGTTDDGLQLRGSSPAANVGSASSAPDKDFLGRSRPLGAGDDVGAYEGRGPIYVSASGSGASGSSWATAYPQLSTALAVASVADDIWVKNGTYLPTTGTDRSLSLSIPAQVTVYGGFNGTESDLSGRSVLTNPTILSGDIGAVSNSADNSYSVVKLLNGAILDGFIIEAGRADGPNFDGNDRGGAWFAGGTVGTMTVRNCFFRNNYGANRAGAIYSGGGPTQRLLIDRCVFENNTTGGSGGAMYVYGDADITNSIFTGNNGSAIRFNLGGGAGKTPSIINSTFFGNTGPSGAAVTTNDSDTLTLTNNIFWNNTQVGGGATTQVVGTSATAISYSVMTGGAQGASNCSQGSGITGNDPLFINVSDPDGPDNLWGTSDDGLQPRASGSAVNSGTASGSPATDLSGTTRPQGLGHDIGAYEARGFIFVNAQGSNLGTSWTSGYTDLAAALTLALPGDEVWVKAGTYLPTTGTDRNATFLVKTGVAIYGGFAGTETSRSQRNPALHRTSLSGDIGTLNVVSDNSHHVLTGSALATVDGFIIRDGRGEAGSPGEGGGGVYVNGGSGFTLANCVIANNQTAFVGGGLLVAYSRDVSVVNCLFAGNSEISPGCYGGAYMSWKSSAIFTNCSFVKNAATNGGAAMVFNAEDNVNPSTTTFRNCLLWGNTSYQINNYESTCTVSIANSIVQGGLGSQVSDGPIVDAGGLSSADPLLTNSANLIGPDGVWLSDDDGAMPGFGGPAVNLSNLSNVPTLDLLGRSRPQMGLPDMGAYEVPNTVTIVATDGSAAEAGLDSGVVTITRSGPTTVPQTVALSVSGSSTASVSDYTIPATVTIPVGAASVTAAITPIDDLIREDAETVVVQLANGSSATVTITSDDALGIVVSTTAMTVSESASTTGTFSVRLTSQPTAPVTISLASGNASEYTINPASLTFQADSTAILAQTVTVTCLNDDLDDGNQVSNLTFSVASSDGGYTGRSVTPISVTTLDDDARALTLSKTALVAVEGGATDSFTVALATQPFSLGAGSTVTVTVSSSPTSQITVAGGASTVLTFTPANWNSPQTVTVAAVNDDVDEASPAAITVNLSASGGDYGAVSRTASANVTDDDATPTLAIGAVSVSEAAGTGTVSVTMSGKSAGTVTVPYATVANTATNGSTTLTAPVTISDVIIPVGSSTGITPGMVILMEAESCLVTAVTGNNLTVTRGTHATAAAAHAQGVTVRFGDYATTTGSLTWTTGQTGAKTFTVSIANDTLNESDESVTVGFSGASTSGGHPAPSPTAANATLTITNDDALPNVQFTTLGGAALTAQSVAEGDSGSTSLTLYATLSAVSGRAVSIPFTVSGTASAGGDFTVTASPITIAPGTTQAAILLTVLGDVIDEVDETVVFTMGTPTNATASGATSFTATLTDNDASPTVQIAAGSSTIAENGTTTLTVTKSHASEQPVTVQILVSGTATQGVDFNVSATSVSIAAGASTGTLTLTGLGDALDEDDLETVILSLSSPTNATLGVTTVATVSLTDDDVKPDVSLEVSKAVGESVGSTTITATISAISGRQVTVPVVVIGGTATGSGTDYSLSTTTLTIPAGSLTAAVTVAITNDDLDESNETVMVAIGSGGNGAAVPTNALRTGADHTLTITDDDVTPSLAVGSASVTEPASTTTVSIPVTLTGKSASVIQVNYSTSNGSATAGADYTAASGTLTWSAGTTGTKNVLVTVSGDTSTEGTETILLTISAATNALIGTSVGTATILDDDVPGLNLSSFAVAATEGDGTGTTIAVRLNTTPVAVPDITVTADADTEVSLTGNSNDWSSLVTYTPSGISPRTVHIRAKDDTIYEGGHTGTVTISTPNPFGADTNYQNLSAQVIVTVTDDEAVPQVAFTSSTASVTEAGTVSLTLQMDRSSEVATTVSYATVGGTAVAGSDFTAATGTVVIPAGSTSGTLSVTTLGDVLDEDNESLTVALSSPFNSTLGAIASATVTITDDDALPSMAFAATTATVAESVGTVTATVQLAAASGRSVSIAYSVSGTTTSGLDHLLSAGTVTLSAGTTTATITLPVVDDGVVEANETVVLTLNTPVNATISSATTTITITDNDTGGIVLSGTSGLAVTEGGATATYGVALTAAPSSAVTVTLTPGAQVTVDTDAATAGSQTTLTFSNLNWAQPQAVTITAVDDLLDETSPMAVTITHAVTAGPGTYPSAASVPTSVNVIDNDVPGVVVTASAVLATAETDVSPSSSGVTAAIQLTSLPSSNVTIPVSLVSGGAYASTEEVLISAQGFSGTVTSLVFTTSGGAPLTLTSGVLSGGYDVPHVLTFTGVDDLIDDGDRTVALTFGTISSSDAIYANPTLVPVPTPITITNRDNDTAALVVTPLNGLTTTEAGGVALFTARLQAKPQSDVTVTVISTQEGEGTVDQPTLTFTPTNYAIPQIVLVTGQNDDVSDDNRAYQVVVGGSVTITNGTDTAYAGISNRTVSLTNLDNDTEGVVLSMTNLPLDEASGSATHSAVYTIRLASRPTGMVTVSINAGSEATVDRSSVSFDGTTWSDPQTITVTAIDDLVAEANPHAGLITHTVTSSDAQDAYAGLTVGSVSLSITDNDTANILVLDADGVAPIGTLTTTENGESALFSMVLGSKPTANVVIVLSSEDPTEGTVTPSSVAFGTSDWNLPKVVTVTGVDDRRYDGDVSWQVVTAEALSSDQAYNNFNPANVTVVTQDDDAPNLVTNILSQLVTSEAGGTAVFQVALATQPAPGKTVTVHASSGNSQEILASSDLIFTPADWNIYQNITLTGIDDDRKDGATTLTIALSVLTASGQRDPDYDAQTATVTATNQDDDVPAIMVSRSSGLVTTESGTLDEFTVMLSCQPAADVAIPLTSSVPSEGRVSHEGLVFTATKDQPLSVTGRTATAGWNVPVTITVEGQDDQVVDGTRSYQVVLGTATTTDPDFLLNGPDVTVSNRDNEVPLNVTPTTLRLVEGSDPGVMTLVLNGQPANGTTVTVPISLSVGTQATLSAPSITFTPANWNQAQTILVTPAADGIADGDAAISVILGIASSSDPVFDTYDAPDLPLTVVDQDVVEVRVGTATGLITGETGSTAVTGIRLGSKPTAEVVLTVTGGGTEVSRSPGTMTFSISNWDQEQSLTFTGLDDLLEDGDQAVPMQIAVASGDVQYNNLAVPPISVVNIDDDHVGILALPTAGSTQVAEGGSADDLAVRLTSQPVGSVTVTLVAGAQLVVTPAVLTFTPENWQVIQSVLVRAVDDAVVEGVHVGSIAISAAGGGYDGVVGTGIGVAITDNDRVGIQVSPITGIVTTEGGGTGAFTVSLKSQPSASVTMGISSGNPGEVTCSLTAITFTPQDYAVPQTVTLTGVDDDLDDGDATMSIVLAPATSADANYQGLDPADVTVINHDDDQVGIVMSPTSGLLTTEAGGTSTIQVRLASRPTATVTLAVASSNPGEATASPASMTFTTGDWNVAQAITVMGQEDDLQDGDAAFQVTVTAASGDIGYAGRTAVASGLNQDADTPGLLISLLDGPLILMEGDTAPLRIQMALRTVPTSPVSIDLTGFEGQATPSSSQVILTDTTPQEVTVMVVDDQAAEGTMIVPLHLVLGSEDLVYEGLEHDGIILSIRDNDQPGVLVTPVSGLTTTEAGGTATFTMVLSAQPISPVRIGLSSSDTGQGTVNPSSLTFTTSSWSIPQTVTVTGADANGLEDGDVGYRIVTAPAEAAALTQDPYHGVDAVDVLIVNRVVDNPPTMAQPADLTFLEDAGLQTVALAGISSGQTSENQSLEVTVATSEVLVTGAVSLAYVDKAATGTLSFTPPANAFGQATITVTVSDGTTLTTRNFPVTITPVNDPPEVTRNQPLTIGLRGTGVLRAAQALAEDANQLAAVDVETASDAVVFKVMLVPGGGVLSVDGLAVSNGGSFTQAQLVAGRVSYLHGGGGGTSDGFTFRVEDGTGGTSTPDVFQIMIDRRAPDVTVAPMIPAALIYVENDSALLLADQATLADADNTSYNSAQVRVAIATGAGTGDILEVVPQTTTRGELTVVAGTIRIDGVVMATLTGGVAGNDLVITGATAAVPADFQAILRCLAYRNGAEAPTPGLRTLTLTVIDPDATSTGAITLRPVTVEAVNDTPQLSSPAVVTATGRPVDGLVSVTDPDGPGITLSLVTPPVKGVVTVDLATGAFSYAPAAGLAGIDTFVIQGTDGLATSAPLTVTIRITGSGSTIRPWIVSDPPMEIQAGELLRLPVSIDSRELPSGFTLSFGVDGAPSGMTVTQDGPTSAVVTWTAVSVSASHVLFTLTATDGVSGSMSTLPVTLRVLPAVGGGG